VEGTSPDKFIATGPPPQCPQECLSLLVTSLSASVLCCALLCLEALRSCAKSLQHAVLPLCGLQMQAEVTEVEEKLQGSGEELRQLHAARQTLAAEAAILEADQKLRQAEPCEGKQEPSTPQVGDMHHGAKEESNVVLCVPNRTSRILPGGLVNRHWRHGITSCRMSWRPGLPSWPCLERRHSSCRRQLSR
jgi:hypothetical protein